MPDRRIMRIDHPAAWHVGELGDPELCLEEIQVQPGSRLAGSTIASSPIKSEFDLLIVGIRRGTEDVIFNPRSDLRMQAFDTVLVMGHGRDLRRVEKASEP